MWHRGRRSLRIASTRAIERRAVAVPTPEGGAIVIFEVQLEQKDGQFDSDLYAHKVHRDGSLEWEQPVSVSTSHAAERNAVAIADGEGGAIVAFELLHRYGPYTGDVDIAGQRISSEGELMWGGGEMPVVVSASPDLETNPQIVSDGEGGAIVAFEREFSDGDHEGDRDIFAQRLSPAGERMWGDGQSSVPVADSHMLERRPSLVTDGAGGALVGFEMEAMSGPSAGDVEIGGQRISPDGQRLWQDGIRSVLVAGSRLDERHPVAVPDGMGGMIVIFQTVARSGKRAGNQDLAAQRVAPNGLVLWGGGDRAIPVATSRLQEYNHVAIPDGSGGAIVAFEAKPRKGADAESTDSDILAQRISPWGTLMWNKAEHSTMVAMSHAEERNPHLVALDDGSAIVLYELIPMGADADSGDIDLAAQRLSPNGKLLWNSGKSSDLVSFSPNRETHPVAVEDGRGNALLFFEETILHGPDKGDSDIAGQFIPGEGTRFH